MSNNTTYTPGTVAEIITTSGVRTGIITTVRNSDEAHGYIVKPQPGHHHEIVGAWKGSLGDILDPIPGERAVIIAREDAGVVIFNEDGDLYVHIMGYEQGRRRVNPVGTSQEKVARALSVLTNMCSVEEDGEEIIRVLERFSQDEKLQEQIRFRLQLA